MRSHASDTELHLNSALPRSAIVSLCVTGGVALLYILRSWLGDIPPEDHVAIALLLCGLLASTWIAFDQIHVTISLSHNRCWVQRHRLGGTTRTSIPVSQIHSAKPEKRPDPLPGKEEEARIVLITSLGMIPVCEHYFHDFPSTREACETINRFLASQKDFLNA